MRKKSKEDVTVCNGENGNSKAENLKLIVKRFQLSNPVYVGDTYGDYLSCKEANVPFILARYGFGEVPQAKHSINSIQDLLDFNFSIK